MSSQRKHAWLGTSVYCIERLLEESEPKRPQFRHAFAAFLDHCKSTPGLANLDLKGRSAVWRQMSPTDKSRFESAAKLSKDEGRAAREVPRGADLVPADPQVSTPWNLGDEHWPLKPDLLEGCPAPSREGYAKWSAKVADVVTSQARCSAKHRQPCGRVTDKEQCFCALPHWRRTQFEKLRGQIRLATSLATVSAGTWRSRQRLPLLQLHNSLYMCIFHREAGTNHHCYVRLTPEAGVADPVHDEPLVIRAGLRWKLCLNESTLLTEGQLALQLSRTRRAADDVAMQLSSVQYSWASINSVEIKGPPEDLTVQIENQTQDAAEIDKFLQGLQTQGLSKRVGAELFSTQRSKKVLGLSGAGFRKPKG